MRSGTWWGVASMALVDFLRNCASYFIFEENTEVKLYNLVVGLREQNNVSAKYPAILEQIEAIMVEAHTPATIERFKTKQLGIKPSNHHHNHSNKCQFGN